MMTPAGTVSEYSWVVASVSASLAAAPWLVDGHAGDRRDDHGAGPSETTRATVVPARRLGVRGRGRTVGEAGRQHGPGLRVVVVLVRGDRRGQTGCGERGRRGVAGHPDEVGRDGHPVRALGDDDRHRAVARDLGADLGCRRHDETWGWVASNASVKVPTRWACRRASVAWSAVAPADGPGPRWGSRARPRTNSRRTPARPAGRRRWSRRALLGAAAGRAARLDDLTGRGQPEADRQRDRGAERVWKRVVLLLLGWVVPSASGSGSAGAGAPGTSARRSRSAGSSPARTRRSRVSAAPASASVRRGRVRRGPARGSSISTGSHGTASDGGRHVVVDVLEGHVDRGGADERLRSGDHLVSRARPHAYTSVRASDSPWVTSSGAR